MQIRIIFCCKTPDFGIHTDFDGTIYFYAAPGQSQYINAVYTVEAGGQTFTVNVDELPLSTQPAIAEIANKHNSNNIDLKECECHSFTLPASVKGGEVTVRKTFSIKEGVTLPEKVSFIHGCIMGCHNCILYAGNVGADKLDGLLAYIAKETGDKALYK